MFANRKTGPRKHCFGDSKLTQKFANCSSFKICYISILIQQYYFWNSSSRQNYTMLQRYGCKDILCCIFIIAKTQKEFIYSSMGAKQIHFWTFLQYKLLENTLKEWIFGYVYWYRKSLGQNEVNIYMKSKIYKRDGVFATIHLQGNSICSFKEKTQISSIAPL